MRRFAALAVALAVVASPLASEAAHPNFAGNWSMDPAASTAGPMTPPAMSIVITQDEKTMNLQTTASLPTGEQKSAQTLNLDGSSTKNTISSGDQSIDLTSTAAWEGDTFVITTKGQPQGQDLLLIDRMTLAPDGKTFTMARTLTVAGQSLDVKWVFKKA